MSALVVLSTRTENSSNESARDLRASPTCAALGSEPEEVLRQIQGLVFWAWAVLGVGLVVMAPGTCHRGALGALVIRDGCS